MLLLLPGEMIAALEVVLRFAEANGFAVAGGSPMRPHVVAADDGAVTSLGNHTASSTLDRGTGLGRGHQLTWKKETEQ
jgi:hypothetical protein